jgi:hypothetical protein
MSGFSGMVNPLVTPRNALPTISVFFSTIQGVERMKWEIAGGRKREKAINLAVNASATANERSVFQLRFR